MEDDFSHFALNKESKELSALENVMRDKTTARYDIIHGEGARRKKPRCSKETGRAQC
jgi:hypothetical protein